MNLRWVERNGEKVLQQQLVNRLIGEIYYSEWQDVPPRKEPEKKIEITEKQFDEIVTRSLRPIHQVQHRSTSVLINQIKKELGF